MCFSLLIACMQAFADLIALSLPQGERRRKHAKRGLALTLSFAGEKGGAVTFLNHQKHPIKNVKRKDYQMGTVVRAFSQCVLWLFGYTIGVKGLYLFYHIQRINKSNVSNFNTRRKLFNVWKESLKTLCSVIRTSKRNKRFVSPNPW